MNPPRLDAAEKRLLLLTLERTLKSEFPNAWELLNILVEEHEALARRLDRHEDTDEELGALVRRLEAMGGDVNSLVTEIGGYEASLHDMRDARDSVRARRPTIGEAITALFELLDEREALPPAKPDYYELAAAEGDRRYDEKKDEGLL